MTLITRNPRAAVRRLALSRLISLTGTLAAFIALVYAVYQRTGSTTWVSAAMLATFAGAGIAGLLVVVAFLAPVWRAARAERAAVAAPAPAAPAPVGV